MDAEQLRSCLKSTAGPMQMNSSFTSAPGATGVAELSPCKVLLQAPSSGHSRSLALERPVCISLEMCTLVAHRNVPSAASIQDLVRRLPDCSASSCPATVRRASIVG
jgi:hypothetical protein